MIQSTDSCSWPNGSAPEKKEFFDNFYRLLDGTTPEECRAWGEMFSPNGKFIAFGKVLEGRDAIENHMLNFWKQFPGLKHKHLKAFPHDEAGNDLIIITHYNFTTSDGAYVTDQTAPHYILEETDGQLQIQQLTLYMDPRVFMEKL